MKPVPNSLTFKMAISALICRLSNFLGIQPPTLILASSPNNLNQSVGQRQRLPVSRPSQTSSRLRHDQYVRNEKSVHLKRRSVRFLVFFVALSCTQHAHDRIFLSKSYVSSRSVFDARDLRQLSNRQLRTLQIFVFQTTFLEKSRQNLILILSINDTSQTLPKPPKTLHWHRSRHRRRCHNLNIRLNMAQM